MKELHPHMNSVISVLKFLFGIAVSFVAFYSFVLAPQQVRAERKACHDQALEQAGTIVAQVQQQNENLEEGQEPAQVNDIAVYDTQYSICLRSKGL